MAAEENTRLIGSSSNTDQEETAKSPLHDPHFLTSFDDRKNASSTSYIEEVIEVMSRKRKWEGLTSVLLLSVMASVLGSSTQFGFNSGVINNPKQAIQDSFSNSSHQFSDTEMNIAVAIFAIGGMLGALPAGLVADTIGRKHTMLLNNVVIWAGVALQSLAVHPFMFVAGRFVVGINSGANTVLVPLYVSEISPVNLRGSMGVCHQMAIVSSILLSQLFGLNAIFGRPDSEFYAWRILFALPLVFSAVQLVMLPWLPESPKYLLIKRKKEEAAVNALQRLRGDVSITEEIKLMKDELAELERPRANINFLQLLTVPYLRRALAVSVALHLAQQLCGITGILYYSSEVFKAAGIQHADIATVTTVGLVLVLASVVTLFLVELLGRRTLMLNGLLGMAVFFAFFTSMFCFQDGFYGSVTTSPSVTVPGVLLVVSSLGITTLFALGPGAIPWLMVAELFMQEARPIAITIATIVNWLANFTVGLVFPYIFNYLFPYGTLVFVGTCSSMWVYLYLFLPETKGKMVEEITEELKKATNSTNYPVTPSAINTSTASIEKRL